MPLPRFPASWRRVAALVLALAATLGPGAAAAQATTTAAAGTARVIVKYRDSAELAVQALAERGKAAAQWPQHAQRLMRRARFADLDLADGRVVAPRVQVLKARGTSTVQLLQRLREDPDVEYAEEDHRVFIAAVPNDPLFGPNPPGGATPVVGQWYLRGNAGEVVSAINAQSAWDLATGAGVVVAVIDTGVRPEHPDLQGKLLPGYDFASDGTNGDGDGPDVDPTDPGDACGTSDQHSWHGTQVAGLVAAASNNGQGMAGTALDAKVLPLRALGKCGGNASDIVAAMRWAAGLTDQPFRNPNPARVVNLSLGSSGNCGTTYQSAVNELVAAGVVVVAAAGNGAGLAALQPSNCNGVIGVAGIRHVGTKVGYSNLGSTLTVAAPAGNCVNDIEADPSLPCLYPLATTSNSGTNAVGTSVYTSSSAADASLGTSFASPLVAGTVALMLQANPVLTPAQVQALLRSSARAFPVRPGGSTTPLCTAPGRAQQIECHCPNPPATTYCGAGMLDSLAAVQAATSGTVPVQPVVVASVSPASPEVGGVIHLSGTVSVPAGRSVLAYEWVLTEGAGIATLSGATTLDQATVVASAPGRITAQLTVTVSGNTQASGAVSFSVTRPGAPTGGGGGGALGWPWLAALALAVLALPGRAQARARR